VEEIRNSYSNLVGKPEGKRPHVRTRHRWEDSIRMEVRDIGREVVTEFTWLRIGTTDSLL
jgi:hypothetical protein